MWELSVPWWHFIIRGVIVYIFLMGLISLTGRRQMGTVGPFDLILLLVLSNAVQNAMNAGDNSVTGGLISATTLLALNYTVERITYQSRAIARTLEGRPFVLIRHGVVDRLTLRHAMITMDELRAALRDHGCVSPRRVRYALLENTGHITVITDKSGCRGTSLRGDGSSREPGPPA